MTGMPWGRVSVGGRDAATLLQGQLTQDVTTAGPGQAPLTGWCTPKGRLLAVCRLLAPAPERFELAMPAELTAEVARRLSMFVLRSQAGVADEGPGWSSIVVTADTATAHGVAPDTTPGAAVEVEGCWWIRLAGTPGHLQVLGPAPAVSALAPTDAAQVNRITAGLPAVYTATREAFIPQMLNLDAIGGVSFRKGCYTGQEIVARTQNLGRIKRRMARYVTEANTPLSPGDRLLHSPPADGTEATAGQVVDREGQDLLAVVALEHAGQPLYAPDGTRLAPRPLPYAVPELPGV